MAEATKIAGVLGWPVSHSLSPKLHNYWLKQLGIDGRYDAFEVEPVQLSDFIIRLTQDPAMRGCNLTIPHKEQVVPMLTYIDDLARSIGAVNTIIVKDGVLHGTNTDAYGFSENIRAQLTGTRKAVILGAGGAARAVCVALLLLGFEQIVITNRTIARAQNLAERFGKRFTVVDWNDRSHVLDGADLLVNTTSLGLKGQDPLEIDLLRLSRSALVTDIVYKPLMTPLLEMAVACGNPVVDGLGMLIYQAVPGFEAWFGQRPDVGAHTIETLKSHVLS